jgi:hypothetical protein
MEGRMRLRDKIIKAIVGESIWKVAIDMKQGKTRNYCFDPVSLTIAAISAAGLTAGATMYSANREASAAKKAANAQKEIAMANIAAAKESETVASQTAKDKLKLRQASRSQTILTDPDLEETNISGKKVLGV